MIDQLIETIGQQLQAAIIAEPTYCIGFVLIGTVVSWVTKESIWNV